MRRSAFYALMLFFALLYTKGLWCRLGVPEMAMEGVLFVLPLVVLLNEKRGLGKPPPGFLLVWFYLGWSLVACIYTGEGARRGLLYARYLVAAYMVFWVVWNSSFTSRQLFWIHAVILAVFFLQVAAASFECLVLDHRTEAFVGTMSHKTGAIATVFPMFAFGCLLAFFLYYPRPVFLLAGFSFFLVGYASGKLAIYYFMPGLLVLGLILYAAAEGVRPALQRGLVVALLTICVSPFLIYLLSHSRRTEMLQDETGVRDKMASFFDYTQRTALSSRSWYTGSRHGTSLRVIEETFRRSPAVFLFGQGTSVFLEMSGQADQGAYDEYGIIYGIVGWSMDALAIGWPAMFAHVGFYTYLFWLLRKHQRTLKPDTYWRAILLAVELGFCVFLITYFFYSPHFTVGGWLNSVYLCFLAVLLAPQYEKLVSIHPRAHHLPAQRSQPWAPPVPAMP